MDKWNGKEQNLNKNKNKEMKRRKKQLHLRAVAESCHPPLEDEASDRRG